MWANWPNERDGQGSPRGLPQPQGCLPPLGSQLCLQASVTVQPSPDVPLEAPSRQDPLLIFRHLCSPASSLEPDAQQFNKHFSNDCESLAYLKMYFRIIKFYNRKKP